tara:strand:+ start:12886 stop:13836 length:951 start_codon:yes stop_codon:yes gene_type:complete
MSKNILVTGSEGSLMQSVIPVLQENHYNIIGVDNFARYGEIERDRNYKFIRGDLTDKDFVNDIMKNIDGVVQAAALIYGVGGFHKYPADILSKDIVLHQNILWAMVENNIKKIAYISSSMVYERSDKHPCKEEDAFEAKIPNTDYGLSKLAGERLCIAFAKQFNIDYTIWRPFNIITPHEKGENEQGISHVFADFVKNLIVEKKNPLPIIGNGEQIRCFTWIEDIANVIGKFSFDDITNNKVYNIGNPEPISMKELANLIYQGDDKLKFETTKDFKDDVKIRIPDISKAQKELNFEPTIKVKEAVKICIEEALRNN